MKKLILSLCALGMVTLSCKENAASKINSENLAIAAERDANIGDLPVISFDKTEHDFGTIENGTPVETVFKYTNTGNAMLVVSKINTTCGCTVPSNFTRQVAPGDTGEFTVKFNGKGNGNKVSKTLTMVTNTKEGNEKVKITAFVEKDPNAIDKNEGPTAVSPQATSTAVKSSTQPGHEGHNHD